MYTIVSILNYVLCIAGLRAFLISYYPSEYNSCVLALTYNVILLYSNLESICTQCASWIHKEYPDIAIYMKYTRMIIKPTNDNLLTIIKNNQIVNTGICKTSDYDMIIYSFGNAKENAIIYNSAYTMKTVHNGNGVLLETQKEEGNFSEFICPVYKTPFVFINISFTKLYNDDVQYQIKLTNDRYNFFVVGNVLNRVLFCYLLKEQHGMCLDATNITYSIDIYDHNVNAITLTEIDEVILSKNTYSIRKTTETNTAVDNNDGNDSDNADDIAYRALRDSTVGAPLE